MTRFGLGFPVGGANLIPGAATEAMVMRNLLSLFVLALALAVAMADRTRAQQLIDKGFVHGWNLMVDPAFGNGCLIQTVYEDHSVARLGFDALEKRGYFAVYNMAWGDIEVGRNYDVTFDLGGQ
ncbi:hypothetical protein [Jhaorihella thermophila]